MARIERSVTINAPVSKVFAFAANPENLPSIWPALEKVSNVKPEANGGSAFDYVYNMGGMRFSGHTDTLEFIPDARIVTQSKSGVENVFSWTFAPENGGTRVSIQVEYKVPVPLVGKIAEAMLTRQNEQQAETVLNNLKAKMQG